MRGPARPTDPRAGDIPHPATEDAISGQYGFYDSGWQIAVLPRMTVRPEAVVDHEITHVNITSRSGFGQLERFWLYVQQLSQLIGSEALGSSSASVRSALRSAGAPVHEAVAWLDSELLTMGKEELSAPRAHAADVRTLRELFASLRDPPFESIRAGFKQVMAIGESIATYALSPPIVDRYAAAPETWDLRDLVNDLRRPIDNPLARFREACKRLERRTFEEAWAWSEGIRQDEPDAWSFLDRARGGLFTRLLGREANPSQWSSRFEWSDEDVAKRVQAVFHRLGVRVNDDDASELQTLVAHHRQYRLLYSFSPVLDRYSQTCVIEIPRLSKRELITDEDGVRRLAGASHVVVSITHAVGFDSPEYLPEQGVLIAFPRHQGVIPTMFVDEPSARYYLQTRPASMAIAASSVGYDVARADFTDREILEGIPHVVVAISDFRTTWQRVAVLSRTGLAGARLIEWQVIAMSGGRDVFGFLLLKPSGRDFPIIVNPTMVDRVDRVLSVAQLIKSPFGTELIESFVDLDSWLGELAPAVQAAVATFADQH